MKRGRLLCFFTLIVIAFAGSHTCYSETTEEMLSACRPITQAKIVDGKVDLQGDYNSGLCWGAFASIHALLLFVDTNENPLLHVCLPSDATRTQLIAVFVQYAEKHPEEYNEEFAKVTINALLKAFPCKAKQ